MKINKFLNKFFGFRILFLIGLVMVSLIGAEDVFATHLGYGGYGYRDSDISQSFFRDDDIFNRFDAFASRDSRIDNLRRMRDDSFDRISLADRSSILNNRDFQSLLQNFFLDNSESVSISQDNPCIVFNDKLDPTGRSGDIRRTQSICFQGFKASSNRNNVVRQNVNSNLLRDNSASLRDSFNDRINERRSLSEDLDQRRNLNEVNVNVFENNKIRFNRDLNSRVVFF